MEKFYQYMLSTIRHSPLLEKMIIHLSHFLPFITFIVYPVVLFYLFIIKSHLLIPTLLKPLCAFLFVTICRKIINRQRPFERMNITPLVEHSSGESFPSRHATSATIIALVCLDVNVYLGFIMICIAFLISLSRILTGVHYISDVIVANIISFIIYII